MNVTQKINSCSGYLLSVIRLHWTAKIITFLSPEVDHHCTMIDIIE